MRSNTTTAIRPKTILSSRWRRLWASRPMCCTFTRTDTRPTLRPMSMRHGSSPPTAHFAKRSEQNEPASDNEGATRSARAPDRPPLLQNRGAGRALRTENRGLHGSARRRLSVAHSTAEIIRMIVAEAGALDLYADLPEGVDGYTDYFTDRNPEVKISQRLAATRYHNRLRLLSLTNTATSGFTRRCGENPNRTRRVRPRHAGPATATPSATPLRTTGWNGRPITSAVRC